MLISQKLMAVLVSQMGMREFGEWRKSGKMRVVVEVLAMWRSRGHRVLLFTQTRQMLNFVELMVRDQGHARYCEERAELALHSIWGG